MMHRYGWSFLIVAALGIMVGLPGADRVVAHEDGRIMFNLSDLADGETRTFGEGEHAVTATRQGDVVSISMTGEDGVQANIETIDCTLGEDACSVMVSTGADVIMLGTDDIDWTDEHGNVTLPDGKMALFLRSDQEHGEHVTKDVRVIRMKDGEDADAHEVMVSLSGAATADFSAVKGEGNAFAFWTGSQGRALHCPEGDTHMNVEKDDDGTYYCPKHNVALEEMKGPKVLKKIHVVTTGDEDDE